MFLIPFFDNSLPPISWIILPLCASKQKIFGLWRERHIAALGDTSSDILIEQTTSRLTNKDNSPWRCLALSPGHVDVPVARSARHLAEGNPDAHCNHQSEGDHPSDHVRRAVSYRKKNTFTHSPREQKKSSSSQNRRVQTLTCCCAAGASQSPGRACSPGARWRAAACRPTRGRCSCCRTPGPAGSSGARSRSGSGRCRSSRCSCPWSSWRWCQSAPSRRSNPCGSRSQSALLLKRCVNYPGWELESAVNPPQTPWRNHSCVCCWIRMKLYKVWETPSVTSSSLFVPSCCCYSFRCRFVAELACLDKI